MESQRRMDSNPIINVTDNDTLFKDIDFVVTHNDSEEPKDNVKIIVIKNMREKEMIRLPDVRRRPGHAIEYRSSLLSPMPPGAMREGSSRSLYSVSDLGDDNLRDISNCIPNLTISNRQPTIQHIVNKNGKRLVRRTRVEDSPTRHPKGLSSYRNARHTMTRQDGHHNHSSSSSNSNSIIAFNNKRPLPPLDAYGKRRWVASTRPVSHSGDRKLLASSNNNDALPAISPRKRTEEKFSDENAKESMGPGDKTSSKQKSNAKKKLMEFLNSDVIGNDAVITTLFGTMKITYLDYIASGKPLKCIEAYIRKQVMPYYANTHTTVSYTGMQTTLFREEARDIIRKSVNAGDDDRVVFTGSGVTSSINKLVHTLNIGHDREEDVYVFVGPYEHHSNILPWMGTKATVSRIPQNADGLIDVANLASQLEKINSSPGNFSCLKPPVIIGAFSAASNVTGIVSPVDEISKLIHKYNGYVIWDYACAGPYVRIDMNPSSSRSKDGKAYKDAIVLSPHKFVGGPGSPGLLIAKKWMFQNKTPHNVGGGTVLFVRRQHHIFLPNPEHSEEGGTPAILESIRAGLAFKLKDTITPEYIMKREEAIMKKSLSFLKEVPGVAILGNTRVERLAILPMIFYQENFGRLLHHDFMAILFNDIFGIQVRSGCACAGPYGLDLLGMSEEMAQQYEALIVSDPKAKNKSNDLPYKNVIYKPGFVRFSLPYFISQECLDFVLAAIHMTAMHGWAMLPQYTYKRLTGQWSPRFKKAHYTLNTNHLSDVKFKSGTMKVTVPSHDDKDFSDSLSDTTSSSKMSQVDYEAILCKAEALFQDALAGAYDCKETEEEKGECEDNEEELRWFIKPAEAANLIHGRKVTKLNPDDLPFMPGAVASKIKYDPRGHKGRGQTIDADFIMEYFPESDCRGT